MTRHQTNATPAGLSPAKLRPMEAKLVDALPAEGDWQFEPKWDGFRCLAFRSGKSVQLMAKSGKPLSRYFPEIVAVSAAMKPDRFVLGGELLIPDGKSLSFDAFQMTVLFRKGSILLRRG